jgi:uncharacterized protein (TIGR02246 family)
MSTQDTTALASLYNELVDAWNRGSGADFARGMTGDVEFIGFDGTVLSGKDTVAHFHDELFRTHLKGTRLVGAVTSVRFLSPDVALIYARGNTIMRGKRQSAAARDSIQTLAAVKQDGAWRLASFQNTRVRPMGRNLFSVLLWSAGDALWNLVLPRPSSEPSPPMRRAQVTLTTPA